MADWKTLASSVVKAPRSSGSKLAWIRPALILEKSRRVLTSLPSRRPLR